MAGRWINYTDEKGDDREVTRNQAIDLIAQGAVPCGRKNGREAIMFSGDSRFWRPVTDGPEGVQHGRQIHRLGIRGMQLVRQ